MNNNHGSPSPLTVKAVSLDTEENSKQKEPVITVADDSPDAKEIIKPHVLIVDDDAHSRFDLELSFLDHDCDVTTAGTCEQALRLLRIDHDGVINSLNQETIPPVDLIIVDYFMVGVPGMTGYMMLPILKKSPMKEIPVIVLAPQPGPQSSARSNKCKEDGADFFVTKPLSHTGVQIFKSTMMKKMSLKKYPGMTSDPMNSNLIMAMAIANDPNAFDNHFHFDENMQPMPNQFSDGNQLVEEDPYTHFDDYLLHFLV